MNHPSSNGLGSDVRSRVSTDEWTARVDLACCYRLLAHYGSNDLTYNHLSMRVPGEPQHLLIKPPTMMFEEVTASSL
ncbi:MAG: class II aldolase/adducin family protein, partial [bacterium]